MSPKKLTYLYKERQLETNIYVNILQTYSFLNVKVKFVIFRELVL